MMRHSKWFLIAYLVFISGSRTAPANPPACPGPSASSVSLQLPLWRGVLCIIAGRYELAIAICNKVLCGDPNDAHAYVVRGYAHLFMEKETQKAITDFSEAIRCDPDNSAILVARALAYRQGKDYDRAIADCTEAIRLDPRNKLAFAARAECYAWKKVTGKAVYDYTAALRIDPELNWARAKRGVVYLFQRREWARALADFDEVLRNNPYDREVKQARCFVYLIYRDFHRAIAEASELVCLEPSEARWYWLRSMIYLAKGEYIPGCYDAVVAVMRNPRAIKFRISPRSFFVFLGPPSMPRFNYESDTKPEERIADCTKRLLKERNNLAAYYERACAYISQRDYKSAAADLTEVLRLDPLDAEAFRARGSLHVELHTYSDALDDYAQAIRIDPGNVENYTGRARTYAAMSKFEEALHDCARSLELDPRFVQTYSIRGWVYHCCKQYKSAIADYSEAIRLSPLDTDLFRRRAAAYCCIWDCAGVIDDYRQIVKLEPTNTHARAQLAGFLCTCPVAQLRNGKEARKLANAACEATSWRDWESLASLALASAECGDFDEAVKWETKAGELVPDSLKSCHEQHLEQYRAHKSYHATLPQGVSASPSSK